MDLLTLVRGPLLALSITIFVVGIAWRSGGLFLLKRSIPQSVPRSGDIPFAGTRAFFTRMVPRKHVELRASATLVTINPYVFHIGLAVVAFGYLPHIAFIKRLTGFSGRRCRTR